LISDKTNPLTEEKVLIYKCSQEYHSILDVRKLNQLPISNIDKIVKAYREFKVDGFSRIVGIDDLQDNYLT
jgi:type I restriction-modification system DNA methylase subunit